MSGTFSHLFSPPNNAAMNFGVGAGGGLGGAGGSVGAVSGGGDDYVLGLYEHITVDFKKKYSKIAENLQECDDPSIHLLSLEILIDGAIRHVRQLPAPPQMPSSNYAPQIPACAITLNPENASRTPAAGSGTGAAMMSSSCSTACAPSSSSLSISDSSKSAAETKSEKEETERKLAEAKETREKCDHHHYFIHDGLPLIIRTLLVRNYLYDELTPRVNQLFLRFMDLFILLLERGDDLYMPMFASLDRLFDRDRAFYLMRMTAHLPREMDARELFMSWIREKCEKRMKEKEEKEREREKAEADAAAPPASTAHAAVATTADSNSDSKELTSSPSTVPALSSSPSIDSTSSTSSSPASSSLSSVSSSSISVSSKPKKSSLSLSREEQNQIAREIESYVYFDRHAFGGYLLYNVQYFARRGGFHWLVKRIVDGYQTLDPHSATWQIHQLPYKHFGSCMKPLFACMYTLTRSFLAPLVGSIRLYMSHRVMSMSEEEMKREDKDAMCEIMQTTLWQMMRKVRSDRQGTEGREVQIVPKSRSMDVPEGDEDPVEHRIQTWDAEKWQDSADEDEYAECFTLLMGFKYFQCHFLERRIHGVNDINRMLDLTRSRQLYSNSNNYLYRPQVKMSTWMTVNFAVSFLNHSRYVYHLFSTNTHVQLMAKAEDALLFLLNLQCFNSDYLDLMWNATIDKHEDVVQCIYTIFVKIALLLSDQHIQHVFQLIRKSVQKDANIHHTRHNIITSTPDTLTTAPAAALPPSSTANLPSSAPALSPATSAALPAASPELPNPATSAPSALHNPATVSSSSSSNSSSSGSGQLLTGALVKLICDMVRATRDRGTVIDSAVALLYDFVEEDIAVPQTVREQLINQIGIFHTKRLQEDNRLNFIARCIQNLQNNRASTSMIAVLHKLIDSYYTSFARGGEELLRHSIIEQLNDDSDLLALICKDLTKFTEEANALWHASVDEDTRAKPFSQISNLHNFVVQGFRHRDGVSHRRTFIYYILKNSSLKLSQEHIDSLWNDLILHNLSLDSYNLSCTWFRTVLEALNSLPVLSADMLIYLFEKKMCQSMGLPWHSLTEESFDCFRAAFIIANQAAKRLAPASDADNEEGTGTATGSGMGMSMADSSFVVRSTDALLGSELLWRIALTTPASHVAVIDKSVRLLIAIHHYLSDQLTATQSARVREAFVTRCMAFMKQAAQRFIADSVPRISFSLNADAQPAKASPRTELTTAMALAASPSSAANLNTNPRDSPRVAQSNASAAAPSPTHGHGTSPALMSMSSTALSASLASSSSSHSLSALWVSGLDGADLVDDSACVDRVLRCLLLLQRFMHQLKKDKSDDELEEFEQKAAAQQSAHRPATNAAAGMLNDKSSDMERSFSTSSTASESEISTTVNLTIMFRPDPFNSVVFSSLPVSVASGSTLKTVKEIMLKQLLSNGDSKQPMRQAAMKHLLQHTHLIVVSLTDQELPDSCVVLSDGFHNQQLQASVHPSVQSLANVLINAGLDQTTGGAALTSETPLSMSRSLTPAVQLMGDGSTSQPASTDAVAAYHILSNHQEYFDLLFALLSAKVTATAQAPLRQSVWNLIKQLPVNQKLFHQMRTLQTSPNSSRASISSAAASTSNRVPPSPALTAVSTLSMGYSAASPHLTSASLATDRERDRDCPINWNELLDASSPFKLLYSLRIVDSLNAVPAVTASSSAISKRRIIEGIDWRARFVQKGGFQHLVRIFLDLTKQISLALPANYSFSSTLHTAVGNSADPPLPDEHVVSCLSLLVKLLNFFFICALPAGNKIMIVLARELMHQLKDDDQQLVMRIRQITQKYQPQAIEHDGKFESILHATLELLFAIALSASQPSKLTDERAHTSPSASANPASNANTPHSPGQSQGQLQEKKANTVAAAAGNGWSSSDDDEHLDDLLLQLTLLLKYTVVGRCIHFQSDERRESNVVVSWLKSYPRWLQLLHCALLLNPRQNLRNIFVKTIEDIAIYFHNVQITQITQNQTHTNAPAANTANTAHTHAQAHSHAQTQAHTPVAGSASASNSASVSSSSSSQSTAVYLVDAPAHALDVHYVFLELLLSLLPSVAPFANSALNLLDLITQLVNEVHTDEIDDALALQSRSLPTSPAKLILDRSQSKSSPNSPSRAQSDADIVASVEVEAQLLSPTHPSKFVQFGDIFVWLFTALTRRPVLESRHVSDFCDEVLCGYLRLLTAIVRYYPQFKTVEHKHVELCKGQMEERTWPLLKWVFVYVLFLLPEPPQQLTAASTTSSSSSSPLLSSPASPVARRVGALAQHKQSRRCAHEFLLELVHECTANWLLLSKLLCEQFKSFNQTQSTDTWDYSPHEHCRSESGYAGLRNLGCTCYMNSFLQQLYMIPKFRSAILNVDVAARKVEADAERAKTFKRKPGGPEFKAEPLEDCMLYQLQAMFAHLSDTEWKAYTPQPFALSIRDSSNKPIDVRQQQDVDEFLNDFMDRLGFYLKPPHDEIVNEVFGGQLEHQLICYDCPHQSFREEPYFALNLQVKNKSNILQSLHTFVEGEMLENDNAYMCRLCNKKVRTLKRVCIKKLPNLLILNLKRFEFNLESMQKVKLNDACSFPLTLSMFDFTKEGLQKAEAKKKEDKEHKEKVKERAAAQLKSEAEKGEMQFAANLKNEEIGMAGMRMASASTSTVPASASVNASSVGAGAAAIPPGGGSVTSGGSGAAGRAESMDHPEDSKIPTESKEEEFPSSYYEYELVGILIHSGTADTGHYYSFIKERAPLPTSANGECRWIEFNDHIVRPFNPQNIAPESYGGWMPTSVFDQRLRKYVEKETEKVKNAYLLFYSRTDTKYNQLANVDTQQSQQQDTKRDEHGTLSVGATCEAGDGTASVLLAANDSEKQNDWLISERVLCNLDSIVLESSGLKVLQSALRSKLPQSSLLHSKVPDRVRRQIWDDNLSLLKSRIIFDRDYSLLIKELGMCCPVAVFPHQPYHKLRDRAITHVKQCYANGNPASLDTFAADIHESVSAVQMLTKYVLEILCHSKMINPSNNSEHLGGSQQTLKDWMQLLEELYKTNIWGCIWFLDSFYLHPQYLRYLIFHCRFTHTREAICQFITNILIMVAAYDRRLKDQQIIFEYRRAATEKGVEVEAEADDSDEEDDGGASGSANTKNKRGVRTTKERVELDSSPSFRFVRSLWRCIADVRVHWRCLRDYFAIFKEFAAQGNRERSFLLYELDLLSWIVDINLGPQSPFAEKERQKRPIMGEKNHPPDYSTMFDTLAQLIRAVRVDEQQRSLPPWSIIEKLHSTEKQATQHHSPEDNTGSSSEATGASVAAGGGTAPSSASSSSSSSSTSTLPSASSSNSDSAVGVDALSVRCLPATTVKLLLNPVFLTNLLNSCDRIPSALEVLLRVVWDHEKNDCAVFNEFIKAVDQANQEELPPLFAFLLEVLNLNDSIQQKRIDRYLNPSRRPFSLPERAWEYNERCPGFTFGTIRYILCVLTKGDSAAANYLKLHARELLWMQEWLEQYYRKVSLRFGGAVKGSLHQLSMQHQDSDLKHASAVEEVIYAVVEFFQPARELLEKERQAKFAARKQKELEAQVANIAANADDSRHSADYDGAPAGISSGSRVAVPRGVNASSLPRAPFSSGIGRGSVDDFSLHQSFMPSDMEELVDDAASDASSNDAEVGDDQQPYALEDYDDEYEHEQPATIQQTRPRENSPNTLAAALTAAENANRTLADGSQQQHLVAAGQHANGNAAQAGGKNSFSHSVPFRVNEMPFAVGTRANNAPLATAATLPPNHATMQTFAWTQAQAAQTQHQQQQQTQYRQPPHPAIATPATVLATSDKSGATRAKVVRAAQLDGGGSDDEVDHTSPQGDAAEAETLDNAVRPSRVESPPNGERQASNISNASQVTASTGSGVGHGDTDEDDELPDDELVSMGSRHNSNISEV